MDGCDADNASLDVLRDVPMGCTLALAYTISHINNCAPCYLSSAHDLALFIDVIMEREAQ